MTTSTSTPATTDRTEVDPIDVTDAPPLNHAEGVELQGAELAATLTFLRTLGPADWAAQTDCPAWDVHRMYLHVLGACEAGASMRENMRQMRLGMKHRRRQGGPLEAALSHVQVEERLAIEPAELVGRLEAVAPRTVRARAKMPRLMRKASLEVDGPVVERWTVGYLASTIYLRDLWMHRIDAARATGRSLELTASHDGRIVADVVAEWARRHGRPFRLTLTGPAGGVFVSTGTDGNGAAASTEGEAPVVLTMDAVEFCRILAGREHGEGLLATIVPF